METTENFNEYKFVKDRIKELERQIPTIHHKIKLWSKRLTEFEELKEKREDELTRCKLILEQLKESE